jgi:hypothetical protein
MGFGTFARRHHEPFKQSGIIRCRELQENNNNNFLLILEGDGGGDPNPQSRGRSPHKATILTYSGRLKSLGSSEPLDFRVLVSSDSVFEIRILQIRSIAGGVFWLRRVRGTSFSPASGLSDLKGLRKPNACGGRGAELIFGRCSFLKRLHTQSLPAPQRTPLGEESRER